MNDGHQVLPRHAFTEPSDDPYEGIFRTGWETDGPVREPASTDEQENTIRLPKLLPAEPTPETASSRSAAKTSAAADSRAAKMPKRQQAKEPIDRRLRVSLGLTALSTILPGAGLLGANDRKIRIFGTTVVTLVLLTSLGLAISIMVSPERVVALAVKPTVLTLITVVVAAFAVFWVILITLTHLATRPTGLPRFRRAIGALAVMALSFAVAAPMAVAARYSYDQRLLVEKVFADETQVTSDSRPTLGEQHDPWAEIPRLNIMLLGGDSAANRDPIYGVRTDTIMVASIDTRTGDTVIIQIPRNVQYTPFPPGSELAEQFPNGFTGEGDSAAWFINALWLKMDDYPSLFEDQTYRGAEALKQGVQGITGLKIDYFVLLNIDGIQQLIDAMGGVTVNINSRLPIGGDTQGRRPSGYLEPGPNQHLNGYDAMWYARSRRSSDDYHRMARQSCLVKAMIDQANPQTMLTSYEAIAAASADMVLTDIPQQALDPLVGLSLKVKDAKVTRLVFSPGNNGYDYANPDFYEMRQAVRNAVGGKAGDDPFQGETTPGSQPTSQATTPADSQEPVITVSPAEQSADSTTPSDAQPDDSASPEQNTETTEPLVDGAQNVDDACAYHPQEE